MDLCKHLRASKSSEIRNISKRFLDFEFDKCLASPADAWFNRLGKYLMGKGVHDSIWPFCRYNIDAIICSCTNVQPRSIKLAPLFWRLLEALKIDLQTKVGWVLKTSGNSLFDRHWNFTIWIKGSWDNWV